MKEFVRNNAADVLTLISNLMISHFGLAYRFAQGTQGRFSLNAD